MTVHNESGTRHTVLDLIVEKGPVTAGAVARLLSLTTAAVRRHIISLENSGDIVTHEVPTLAPRGRGRPARYYVATDQGRDRPGSGGHAELALKAICYLQQAVGSEAVDAFAAARMREIERRYAPVINAVGSDPGKRAVALADALTADGYAASIRKVGTGDFAVQLCQGQCPIERVAGAFPQFCEAETAAFGKLLGVHVQRLATLAQGEHVCTTVVPVSSPTIHPRARRVMESR